jgi:hypothetical protein
MTSTAVFPGTASASALLVPSSGTPFRGPFSRRGTRAPAVLTKSVAPLGRRSSPVCESRPNRHCLFQAVAHRSGRRGSDRSRHTQSTARPTRKPMAFPHRTVLGNRPCPCSFRAAPHCLFQAVAHGFGSRPADQGHPREQYNNGSAEPTRAREGGSGTHTLETAVALQARPRPEIRSFYDTTRNTDEITRRRRKFKINCRAG